MTRTSSDDLSPLAADLRRHDPDRYLSTLFAPVDRRKALFALYAFDHEIAKIKRVVREPMAGLIRLQWWRDAIEAMPGDHIVGHPVIEGLHEAIEQHVLDRDFLLTAIEAREADVEETNPADSTAFEERLSLANGSIVKAAVILLDHHGSEALFAADHLGISLGLLEKFNWLRDGEAGGAALRTLPTSLLAEHGLADRDDVSSERHAAAGRDGITCVRQELAFEARRQLALARQYRSAVSRRLLPVFFPGTLAEIRLRHPDRSREHPAMATALYRLLWHWLRGSF